MPSNFFDPTSLHFRFCLAESWKSVVSMSFPVSQISRWVQRRCFNKSCLGKLHLCCLFDLIHGKAAAGVHPLTISTVNGYVEWWDTEAARPVGRSCLPHSRSTEHQSCVNRAKRKGCFSVYKISSYLLNFFHNVVIPLHSAADPKDPRQSLRRASSFAPQRPLEPCHRPLAHSHRPWEAKALKIHHPSMHPSTRKNALKVIQHCSTLRAHFCTLTWLQLTASPVSLKHCFMSLMLQADLSISDADNAIVQWALYN